MSEGPGVLHLYGTSIQDIQSSYSRLCMYARSLFLGSCGTGGLQEEEGIKVVGGRARVGIWSCRSGGNN